MIHFSTTNVIFSVWIIDQVCAHLCNGVECTWTIIYKITTDTVHVYQVEDTNMSWDLMTKMWCIALPFVHYIYILCNTEVETIYNLREHTF